MNSSVKAKGLAKARNNNMKTTITIEKSVNANDLVVESGYDAAASADNYVAELELRIAAAVADRHPGAEIDFDIYVNKDRNNTDCSGASHEDITVCVEDEHDLSAASWVASDIETIESKLMQDAFWLVSE
jgi:hypothetical protein